jgi:hypothetical protein
MRGGIAVLTIHRYGGATGGDRRERFPSVSYHVAELTAKTVSAARAMPVVGRRSTSRAGSADLAAREDIGMSPEKARMWVICPYF